MSIISVFFYLNLTVESKQVIYIPKGSTSSIITYLDKKEYELNIIDKLTINYLGYPQNGWIDLKSTQMSKFDFLHKLTTSKAALRNVTLIPGETYYFFLKEVALKLKISEELLFVYYNEYAFRKDGNILAQTYALPIGMDEEELILYLIKYTNKQYEEYSNKIFGQYNQENWFKYISIASVIQKEAANVKEMPTVSSVIYNRLKKGMKLQMDGTLNYGKYSHTRVTPKMIRTDKSSYNTYKYKSIPSHPVCAVEFNSIKSAVFPQTTKYLYFMKSYDGKGHIFTTSYKNHKKVIQQIRKAKRTKRPPVIKKTIIKSQKKKKPINIKSIWSKI